MSIEVLAMQTLVLVVAFLGMGCLIERHWKKRDADKQG